jgi:hypothetical protein
MLEAVVGLESGLGVAGPSVSVGTGVEVSLLAAREDDADPLLRSVACGCRFG